MNINDKQEEHYSKALKHFIDCGNEFQKLTPENRERLLSQLAQGCGVLDFFNALRKQF